MIICRTPFRTSFFGGGTDYEAWYREHGGAVLTTTIKHYCYITCRRLPPFFEHKSRIVWSQVEKVNDNSEIMHPVVRAALDYLEIRDGVEIHHDGDLPARSGLGSSSSFTVGILNALYALKGMRRSKTELAQQAIHLEREILAENIGVQDQIQTCFGGLNKITIRQDGNFEVNPMVLSSERAGQLESHLLMFFTGLSRRASDIAGAKIKAIPKKSSELHTMAAMVDEAVGILSGAGDICDFGRLLDESWKLKRQLADEIAPDFVNDLYDKACAAGAIGGKLLGAGGGGFMMFFVRPEDQKAVIRKLDGALAVPIKFDSVGTQIIFYEPDGRLISAENGVGP